MKITKEQYEELLESHYCDSKEDFHKLLEKYTDIVAHPFVSYIYADCGDNYVGDSENFDLRDILRNAYIEIGD